MPLYEPKTVPVEAIQWTGDNLDEICKFTGSDAEHLMADNKLWINTRIGLTPVLISDFIIKLDTSRPSRVLNTTHVFAVYPEQRFHDRYKPIEKE